LAESWKLRGDTKMKNSMHKLLSSELRKKRFDLRWRTEINNYSQDSAIIESERVILLIASQLPRWKERVNYWNWCVDNDNF